MYGNYHGLQHIRSSTSAATAAKFLPLSGTNTLLPTAKFAGLGVGVLALESEKSLPTGLKVLALLLTVFVGDSGPRATDTDTKDLLLLNEEDDEEFTVKARGTSQSIDEEEELEEDDDDDLICLLTTGDDDAEDEQEVILPGVAGEDTVVLDVGEKIT